MVIKDIASTRRVPFPRHDTGLVSTGQAAEMYDTAALGACTLKLVSSVLTGPRRCRREAANDRGKSDRGRPNGFNDETDRSGVRSVLYAQTRGAGSPCSRETMYINNNTMDADSARTIAEDYIRYRLESNGLSWQNGQRDVTPNDIQRAMRAMGDEFESRFSQAFDDMINQLHITTDTAYHTFKTIVNEIFSDGVNWGRIVALFGFGGKLAVRCVQQSMPQLVSSIVDWVTAYVDTTLKSWLAANNGWEGFLEFYEGGPEKRTKDSWPSFKTICSYAAAGLGILTLGAFLSQKS